MRRALSVLLLAWVLTTALAMGFADRLIFVPPPPSYGPGPGVLSLPTRTGDRIAARWVGAGAGGEATPEDAAPRDTSATAGIAVLFAHGNAEDLGDVAPFASRIAALGASVLLFDYPGYGASTGTPSEEGAYAAAEAAYRHLVDELGVPPEAVVAHGRSLGGAVVVDLAARYPVGGLVLESTFVSAYRVLTRVPILPFDQFETLAKLADVDAPVLVVHGEDDEVVPIWHGRRLFEALPEGRREALWVPGAHHNDLETVAGSRYGSALARFFARVGSADRDD